ncbi:MAG: sugar O-acyltransferase (sialic acid O-acetyltransferase NeuD family) [Pseudoalteromonas tetraodonis]
MNHLKERQVSRCLAIIGASGHGKVIAEIAELLGYEICFFDDAFPEKNHVEHWPIKGSFKDFLLESNSLASAVVAIGNAKIRESILIELQSRKIATPTLIHPSAIVSKYAEVDDACVVMAGAVINAFATIGKGCIINSNSVVEHDCKLADYVHVCPNSAVAGGTIIGERTWVGIGTNVRQMISIGADVLIGAGSVVVKDIPSGQTVIGVPAQVLKQ